MSLRLLLHCREKVTLAGGDTHFLMNFFLSFFFLSILTPVEVCRKMHVNFHLLERVVNYQWGNWWNFHLYIIAFRRIPDSNLKL